VRLLVWILGVECTLAALMDARRIAPSWAWAWWTLLGFWILAGVVVAIAAAVRVVLNRASPAAHPPVPQRSAAPLPTKGGE
jgi:hypothetical protein